MGRSIDLLCIYIESVVGQISNHNHRLIDRASGCHFCASPKLWQQTGRFASFAPLAGLPPLPALGGAPRRATLLSTVRLAALDQPRQLAPTINQTGPKVRCSSECGQCRQTQPRSGAQARVCVRSIRAGRPRLLDNFGLVCAHKPRSASACKISSQSKAN